MFILIAAIILPANSAYAQGTTRTQIEEYRKKMKREARDDSQEAQRLREERRDLLRKGVPADQIREQQTRQIDKRRLPDQGEYYGSGSGGEGPWSGFVIYTAPTTTGEFTTE